MEKIYIVLTYTGTILSRTVRIFTRNTYTHASIALDKDLEKMYSFGRLNPYNPFWGGFVKEGIDIGTFKRFKNTKTEIYSFEVTKEEYKKLEEKILEFNNNRKNYKFNIIGLIYARCNKQCKRKNKFYCSQFVREVIEQAEINMENIEKVIKPQDFKKIKGLNLEYKGLLNTYNLKSA